MDRCFYICCRRGCPRRSLDSGRIYNYLKLNGWKPIKKPKSADLILVYTCGGFQRSEDRSLLTINKIINKKRNGARLLVTGCLTKINPEPLEDFEGAQIVDSDKLNILDSVIDAKIPYKNIPDPNTIPDIPDLSWGSLALRACFEEFKLSRRFVRGSLDFLKPRLPGLKKAQGVFPDDVYNLKIAQGCLGRCTYCAIKLANGKLISKPSKQILKEFQDGLNKDFKRYVLIGEDTGCYGQDKGTNIVSLLDKIFAHKECFSLIINDFNINWLIKYYDRLLPLFVSNIDKIEDLRVPIQSGSDRILRLMKRPYKIDDVKAVLSDLKSKLPELKILTHILVGFPGETHSDFEKSRQLLEDFCFAGIDLYCYEDRPGTAAYNMRNKIPSSVKMKRFRTLMKY